MSLKVTLETTGMTAEQLGALDAEMANRLALHEKIAGEAEAYILLRGPVESATRHRTATRLGASPTGHLEKDYAKAKGVADESSAALLLPRASRLRAAFGPYVCRPGPGHKFLTIPVNAAAYGRRAREFDDLVPIRAGPKKTLILARDLGEGRLETMYVLVPSVSIPEDSSLINWDKLAEVVRDTAEEYFDKAVERTLSN